MKQSVNGFVDNDIWHSCLVSEYDMYVLDNDYYQIDQKWTRQIKTIVMALAQALARPSY